MTEISHSQEQTKFFAKKIASQLRGGDVVILDGGLGSGKTTFTQGLCEAFGVKELVRSPTFTVMNIHQTEHPDIRELVHVDFYRMKKPEEAFSLGLEEWMWRKDTIVLAEWGSGFLDEAATARVSFEILGPTTRRISFNRIIPSA